MSKLKKKLWLGASVVAALMIVVGTVYAWTHSGYVTIQKGISIGEEIDPGDKVIRFESCGLLDPGYIVFRDEEMYITAMSFLWDKMTLVADEVTLTSKSSAARIDVHPYGDVIITIGE